MIYFLDTGALAKCYVVEAGSAWIVDLAISNADNVIFIAQIIAVEMASLLARHTKWIVE